MPVWVETDDPADPCGYCVQWLTPEQFAGTHQPEGWDGFYEDGTYEMDRMAPYMPDGLVERLYRGYHESCQAMVDKYMAEAAKDPT